MLRIGVLLQERRPWAAYASPRKKRGEEKRGALRSIRGTPFARCQLPRRLVLAPAVDAIDHLAVVVAKAVDPSRMTQSRPVARDAGLKA